MNSEQVTIIRPILKDLKYLVRNPEDLQTLKDNILVDFNKMYVDRLDKVLPSLSQNFTKGNKFSELIDTVHQYLNSINDLEDLEDFKTDFNSEISLFFGK